MSDKKDKSNSVDKDEKKQVLLRLSNKLWRELSIWAEEDFRSLNSQIEYLLFSLIEKYRK